MVKTFNSLFPRVESVEDNTKEFKKEKGNAMNW